MPTIYSSTPYFDDFDETKQYYRMLFRPGRAVQARELTQLQTLLQAQIERFGKNVFKDGSIVIPAEQVYDPRYSYVKLQTTYNSVAADDVVANLVDDIVEGATTGVRALVINHAVSTTTDEPTIYVKYLNSGDEGNVKTFADNEVITNEASTISVRAIEASATGNGSAYSIGQGVLFTKGSFVYINEQTKILEKYSVLSNGIVGLQVTESVVESPDDESLLDPAIDTFNYFAPGADRYKITFTLDTREFTAAASDDPNFIELARIEDGLITAQNLDPEYAILADTLARRTFDESGDYVVRPFPLKLIEHLRTSNANVTYTTVNGRYTAAEGGNADLFVNVITPGKAYVKGYEIDTIRTKFVNGEKARDFVTENQGTVATEIGNYVFVSNVHSVPALSNIVEVDIYDRKTETARGTAEGTKVGTARARHIEFSSGTIGDEEAIYKLYLFDISMNDGKTFVDNAKQFYYDNPTIGDFTADVSTTSVSLTGTVSNVPTTNTFTGVGTLFNTELSLGDYINVDDVSYRVIDIQNNNLANVYPAPAGTISGVPFSIEKATLREPNKNVYVFPLPQSVIKSVDSTGLETTYSSRRAYSRTLVSGNITITAGTDEVFAPVTSTNYSIIVGSGGNAGDYINPTGNIIRSGSPTGKSIVIYLSDDGYTNESVEIITTVQKSESAADRKVKTLVNDATLDFTTEAAATASTISLGKADIFKVESVSMSANAFGTPYFASNAVDITSRYNLDTGQRTTFYDLGSLTLKPGAAKPSGPIRVTFDYFTHSSGDYFSVESYGDIDYKDIPVFSSGDTDYNLRDCLDFRPRVNDAGTGFTSTGASTTEMISQEVDFVTDYEYYLPRTDKIILDRNGSISVVKGVSSQNPQEPRTPDNAIALYILKQDPYVFDLYKDIEIIEVDNKRYTMRDIGRIDNRVKNLEYYTSLNLLENEAEKFQVKDAQGFDRFKNGFIVDSFTGHGIGDVYNQDYGISVDFNKQEARPLCDITTLKVTEVNETDGDRTTDNYVLKGDLITVPYTEEKFISNEKASKVVNLNPFNIITFAGAGKTVPPNDIWFETNRLPDLKRNVEGNYDSVLADAQAKGTYGTVWGAWRDLHYGNGGDYLYQVREGIEYTVKERIDTKVVKDKVVSKDVIPKMRDVVINIKGEAMKPNTQLYAFFDGIPVTSYCTLDLIDEVAATKPDDFNPSLNTLAKATNAIKTDAAGNVSVNFNYTADVFNFDTGVYVLRLTDSPTNNPADTETFVETEFSSSGELRNIRNEIISTRNAKLTSKTVSDDRSLYVGSPPSAASDDSFSSTNRNTLDFVSGLYKYGLGREPDPEGYAYWSTKARERGISAAYIQAATTSTEFIAADGDIIGLANATTLNIPASYNFAAYGLAELTNQFMTEAVNKKEQGGAVGEFARNLETPRDVVAAAATLEYVTGLINATPDYAYYNDAQAIKTNGVSTSAVWRAEGDFST